MTRSRKHYFRKEVRIEIDSRTLLSVVYMSWLILHKFLKIFCEINLSVSTFKLPANILSNLNAIVTEENSRLHNE